MPAVCTGDCNGDGSTNVNELVFAVLVALEGGGLENCLVLDTNGDLIVSINELIVAVGTALNGC